MKFFVFLAICSSLFCMLVYCERRIFGGQLARPGQFPYQVSLLLKGRRRCTGSIIDESWVITAAHCVMESGETVNTNDVAITAGYVKEYAKIGRQIATASQIIVHSDYNMQIYKHDLALVKVQRPFEFNKLVGKISLSDDPWPSKEGKMCTIAGFGRNENKTFDELRYLQVKTFHGKDSCPCIVKSFQLKRLVCLVPKEGQGTCFGDSGGGMIRDGKVAGIAHMVMDKRSCKYFEFSERSIDCGSENIYAMYIYICPALNWIKKYVPSVPGTPESCNGNIITPSMKILFLCLYVIITIG